MSNKQNYYMLTENPKEISIKGFFDVIKNGLWIILVVTILSSLAGYMMSDDHVSLYQTSTRIIIGSDNESMKTLMVMIKDPIIMEEVKENLQLSRSSEGIASQVEIMRLDDSQVVKITVTDTEPVLAAAIANATALAFKNKVVDILEFDDVQLLSSAKENHYPINESQNQTMIISILFGLVVGIGLVFLLDSLDVTVKKSHEIEAALGVPVLGTVTKIKIKRKRSGIKDAKPKQQKLGIRSDIGEVK